MLDAPQSAVSLVTARTSQRAKTLLVKADSHIACRAHAAPLPCSDHAVLLKATAQHDRLSTAVLCRGFEKNDMVGAWHGRGMASVNQTRPLCINQMGKTHSKPLAARHGRGTAWARHGHGMLCVNRPF